MAYDPVEAALAHIQTMRNAAMDPEASVHAYMAMVARRMRAMNGTIISDADPVQFVADLRAAGMLDDDKPKLK